MKKNRIIITTILTLYVFINQCYSQKTMFYLSNNLYGVKHLQNDSIILFPQYNKVVDMFKKYNIALVFNNKKWGMINSQGKLLLNYEFDTIKSLDFSSFVICSKNKSIEVYNTEGVFLKKGFDYDGYLFFIKDYCAIKRNNLWGIVNNKYDEIIPCQYDSIYYLLNYHYLVFKNKKPAIINYDGKIIIPFEYDEIMLNEGTTYRSDTLVKVKKNGKYGVISLKRENILPFEYEDIHYGYKILNGFIVKKNNKWGIVDFKNNIVISFKYDEILLCRSSFNIVRKNTKIGIIDWKENTKIDFIYDNIDFLNQYCNYNLLEVRLNNKIGVIDTNGNEILKIEYDEISNYFKNYIQVVKGKKYGLYILNIKKLIPPIYEYIGGKFNKNLCPIKIEGKFDFIDTLNKRITFNQYDSILIDYIGFEQDNCNSPYLVVKNNKYGYVSSEAKKITDFDFDFDEEMIFDNTWENNRTIVFKNGKYGIIDISGKIVVPIEFDKKQILKKLDE